MYSADFRCLALRLLKTVGSYHRATILQGRHPVCGKRLSTVRVRAGTVLDALQQRLVSLLPSSRVIEGGGRV